MPIIPNFTASVNYSTNNILHLEDTSTGTDVAIAKRRVTLQKSDGTYLVTSGTTTTYMDWSLSFNFIDLNVLDRDYALNITVQWLNSSNTVLYTKTLLFDFTTYSELFYYSLTQYQTANPNIINDTKFYTNKLKLRTCIDEANQAISVGSDIQSSQAALNRAKFFIDNPTIFF